MKKILLVYPPFCTPAGPPYSLANLYGFLNKNIGKEFSADVLDLNSFFHKNIFPKYREFYKSLKKGFDFEEYNSTTKKFQAETKVIYSKSNFSVVKGKTPELFDEVLGEILKCKPDYAAFSIVYSSQAFYAVSIISELKKRGIKTIIGGPAVNEKLIKTADAHLKNEVELLGYLTGKGHEEVDFDYFPDYSKFNFDDYFTPKPVVPIRTCTSCFYKQCAFCSHHQGSQYFEFPIDRIKKSIESTGQKHFFIVDDMIHKKRLLEIAKALKPLKIFWSCQLRPTKDMDYETLKTLKDAGLSIIVWGVESGCNRVLNAMKKGTNKEDIAKVLSDSKKAGIKNGVYILLGFPTETKDDFLETISFLKENKESIDIVSTSVFGLQRGTPAYDNPKDYGITRIIEEKRTILEPKISYEVASGMTNEEAADLKRRYKKTLESFNKYPKEMNFFREHMLAIEE